MSRRKTRTLTGFAATTFVGFGLAAVAPAAMADTNLDVELLNDVRQPLETLDLPGEGGEATLEYQCATTDGIDDSVEQMTVGISAPNEAETGQTIQVSGGSDAFYYYYPSEEIAAGDASLEVEFQLSGDAAPTDSISFTLTNTEAFAPGQDDITWSEPELVDLDLTTPGELNYVAGTVTTSVDQATGNTTTVCDPTEPEAVHATNVTGDPIEDDEDEDSDDQTPPEDEDEDETPPEDEDDEQTPPEEEDDEQTPPEDEDGDKGDEDGKEEAGGGLPVTGAALGGLVAAAVAALGGGGGAMYLARKRRNNAAATEE